MLQIRNFCLFFIVTNLLAFTSTQAKTPIIGIVSFPSEGWDDHHKADWNYIATSYVKWIQSAGAKVVPIQWDLPYDELDDLIDQLNGVVFMGGNIHVHDQTDRDKPSEIFLAFEHMTEYILEKNKHGTFYPLWGTCMGFWNIARVLGGDMDIITKCDDCIYVRRNVHPEPSLQSRMLKDLPDDLKTKIKEDKLSVFLHHNMIKPEIFEENSRLSRYLTPVAYSYDASKERYVSMAESPRYPIYTAQFHAEKPAFEWSSKVDIPHTKDAMRFGQYLANFFVSEARKNTNVFPDNKNYVIENYSPTTLEDAVYSQVYFFPTYDSDS